MRSRIGTFWYSLLLTLLLLLPMMGAVLFFANQRQNQNRVRQVAAGQGGITVEQGAQTTHRLLLVVQQERPGFVLLRMDDPAQQVTFCSLPGDLLVNAPVGTTTLAECAAAAGPGRCVQLLSATLATGETALSPMQYLAATPDCWAVSFGRTAGVRLVLDGQLTELTAAGTADFLAARQDGDTLRACLWEGFARQNPEALQAMPDALRQNSARTLTDLTAQDYTALEESLQYLCAQSALTMDWITPDTAPAPGGVQLTDTGTETLRRLLQ